MKFKVKIVFKIISNKYVIATVIFLITFMFFDRYDYFSQKKFTKELLKLRSEHQYYKEEIANTNNQINLLQTDKENLEKFAREKYLMKKKDEDIFFVVSDSSSITNEKN